MLASETRNLVLKALTDVRCDVGDAFLSDEEFIKRMEFGLDRVG
jgi:hypothetical protein